MGDRGNIVVQESEGERVYLYGHWSGHDMPEILRSALARGKDRWDDPQYLARIIFCEMTKSHPYTDTTGFGITSSLHDNEHPIIVVDCEKQEIRLEAAPKQAWSAPKKPKTWTLQSYADLPAAEWGHLDEARKTEVEDDSAEQIAS